MALNIEKAQNKLKELESGKKTIDFNKLLWKPVEGTQKIRILPYRPKGVEQDTPFIELKFIYKFNGIPQLLVPSTFGKPDPFKEYYESLRSNGTDQEKELADKHFKSVSRTYVPIIVRGKEDEGVKFWGFGVQVYKQLLSYCTPDWGDITSLTEGNDIEVKFIKAGTKRNVKTGEPFPETTIVPSPKKTIVVSPSNTIAMESIRNQLDITDVFPLKPYDELKKIIDDFLNPEEDGQEPSVAEQNKAASVETPAKESVTSTPTPTAEEVADDFAKFFGK